MAGKGDDRRPSEISPEEYAIKFELATGKITEEECNKRIKELK